MLCCEYICLDISLSPSLSLSLFLCTLYIILVVELERVHVSPVLRKKAFHLYITAVTLWMLLFFVAYAVTVNTEAAIAATALIPLMTMSFAAIV